MPDDTREYLAATPAARKLLKHTTGATRSAASRRFDLVPQAPLERLADPYAMGNHLHGAHNYKLGLPFDDTFNHIVAHLLSYKERRKLWLQAQSEGGGPSGTDQPLEKWMEQSQTDGDDLAAAAWGIFTLMQLEATGRLK